MSQSSAGLRPLHASASPVVQVLAAPSRSDLLLALTSATMAQGSLSAAAAAFCVQLARTVGASRVAVGLFRTDVPRLIGLSEGGPDTLDRQVAETLSAAMHECRDQGMTLCAGFAGTEIKGVDVATRRLRQLQQGRVIVAPIVSDHEVVGAVTFELAPPPSPDVEGRAPVDPTAETGLVRWCEDQVLLAAPYLLALNRDQRTLWQRLADALQVWRTPRRLHDLKAWQWGLVALAMVVLVLAVLPMTVTIGAPARVEGAIERVIAAPVDGFIKSAAVRPGDSVVAGQIVAELIDRDLQLERSRYQAESTQHANALAAAMARSDRAEMMIHQARLAEARAQAGLIDQQLDRIQMRAPIDGVIIHGDLSQKLGAPVEKGQVLMTAAPRDQRRVIVEVDERDIHRVRPGQSGRLSVAALPWEWSAITVGRITPMAQVVEGRNVFEVEAQVEASSAELRPGLRGVARLEVGEEPPLWTWGRRLMDHLHRFVWRWLP